MQLSVSVSWTVIILTELKFKKQLISDAWMQPKKIRVAAMEYKLWHKIREEKSEKCKICDSKNEWKFALEKFWQIKQKKKCWHDIENWRGLNYWKWISTAHKSPGTDTTRKLANVVWNSESWLFGGCCWLTSEIHIFIGFTRSHVYCTS